MKDTEEACASYPVSIFIAGDELQGEWRDLPVASFAEAGTNVPTTMLKLRRAA